MSDAEILRRLTSKKGDELSKLLYLDSVSPSTEVIANMQKRHRLLELSIDDYRAMCNNNVMKRMMSKVIGCNVKQLSRFCKYINVFITNIESSPKSIKNKMIESKKLMRGSLYVLPDDILEQIVNKYKTIFKLKYILKDWIPIDKLIKEGLSENPNAIDFLKENKTMIDWNWLLKNPNPKSIELLKENSKNIEYNKFILADPNAIKLIKEDLIINPEKIDLRYLSRNPAAIEILKKKIQEEKEIIPSSSEFRILNNKIKVDWNQLSMNPNAIDILKANPDKISWQGLSVNTNTEAIELLRENPTKIYWDFLSTNKNPEAIELLKTEPKKISWWHLSKNTSSNAIDLLEKNQDNINWRTLSANPNAIELIKANPAKIDWFGLSANENPAAIEILKQNQNEINWYNFSKNPGIFDEVI